MPSSSIFTLEKMGITKRVEYRVAWSYIYTFFRLTPSVALRGVASTSIVSMQGHQGTVEIIQTKMMRV